MSELLLMCIIGGHRAAIPAIRVQSVIEIEEITPIPGVPSFILGLTALRSQALTCLLYTSPSPRDRTRSRMPSSA